MLQNGKNIVIKSLKLELLYLAVAGACPLSTFNIAYRLINNCNMLLNMKYIYIIGSTARAHVVFVSVYVYVYPCARDVKYSLESVKQNFTVIIITMFFFNCCSYTLVLR